MSHLYPSARYQKTEVGTEDYRCAFIGYSQTSNTYHFLDLDSNIIIKSRDEDFFEDKFVSDKKTLEPQDDAKDTERLGPSEPVIEEPTYETKLRRSKHLRKEK